MHINNPYIYHFIIHKILSIYVYVYNFIILACVNFGMSVETNTEWLAVCINSITFRKRIWVFQWHKYFGILF